MTPGPASWLERTFGRFIPEDSEGLDRQLRLYLAFVFVLFTPTTAFFAGLDWLRGERVTAVLVAAICVILLSSLWTLRRARDIRWGYRLVLGAAVALLQVVVYIGGGGGFAVLWSYAFPAGFYYVFGAREGTVWVLALAAPQAVILFTEAGASYPADLAHRYVVTYALLSALALGLQWTRESAFAAVGQEKKRLEEALARVRTLSEMLPMCAWCGKVRDDEGYWSRIEEYLKNQTGTEVSHGVCEECAAKLEADAEAVFQRRRGGGGAAT